MAKEAVLAFIQKFKDWLANGLEIVEGFEKALKEIPEEVIEAKEWDPNKIKWVKAEGFSGPYERYPAKGEKAELSADYKHMLADLKAHNGKLMRDGYFYWVFDDGATIGRKKRA